MYTGTTLSNCQILKGCSLSIAICSLNFYTQDILSQYADQFILLKVQILRYRITGIEGCSIILRIFVNLFALQKTQFVTHHYAELGSQSLQKYIFLYEDFIFSTRNRTGIVVTFILDKGGGKSQNDSKTSNQDISDLRKSDRSIYKLKSTVHLQIIKPGGENLQKNISKKYAQQYFLKWSNKQKNLQHIVMIQIIRASQIK